MFVDVGFAIAAAIRIGFAKRTSRSGVFRLSGNKCLKLFKKNGKIVKSDQKTSIKNFEGPKVTKRLFRNLSNQNASSKRV